jgi:hypothetical protein
MTHSRPLTRERAALHEALYLQLERLTAQIAAIAQRKPEAPVPEATRAIAADLLYEAQRFADAPDKRRLRGMPEPAGDVGGLATQLGRALSRLDAWEAANSAWNADLKCFVWLLRDPLPVARLRPQTAAIVKSKTQQRQSDERRRAIFRQIESRFDAGYDAGFADASNSRQHKDATG